MARFEIRLLPRPRLLLRQNLPEKARIKKVAHALTVLVVAWSGVSIFALVAYFVGKQDGDSQWTNAAIWIWRLHALIAALALGCWIFEKPSEVRYCRKVGTTNHPTRRMNT
jgi:uncharacterized membrane protein